MDTPTFVLPLIKFQPQGQRLILHPLAPKTKSGIYAPDPLGFADKGSNENLTPYFVVAASEFCQRQGVKPGTWVYMDFRNPQQEIVGLQIDGQSVWLTDYQFVMGDALGYEDLLVEGQYDYK